MWLIKILFVVYLIFLGYLMGYNSGYNNGFDWATQQERKSCEKQMGGLQCPISPH